MAHSLNPALLKEQSETVEKIGKFRSCRSNPVEDFEQLVEQFEQQSAAIRTTLDQLKQHWSR